MKTEQRILIATRNQGKLGEIRAKLADVPVAWQTLRAFGEVPTAVEDAETFLENAVRKAIHYSLHCGMWALADDSGLEVDALAGAPGVWSARYAGLPGSDSANNQKLLSQLRDVPDAERTARFRCAVAIADRDRVIATAVGVVEGLIVDRPRGCNGFGYDPHFLLTDLGMTAAELPLEMKNRISHRARALAELRPRLLELMG